VRRNDLPREEAAMKVLFIEQDHVSLVGPVGERFAQRGYDVVELVVVRSDNFANPAVSVDFPDPTQFDAIVPMGAPWSIYDRNAIGSWIDDELAMLATAHRAGVPLMGICFGGQALAAALGGTVESADEVELGWQRVETDAPDLVEPGPWFQWHGDRWTLPPGATEIARSPLASQAFTLGRTLALQFHPETLLTTLVGWNDNGGEDYLRAYGVDRLELERQTALEEPAAIERAHRLVDRFLDDVATRRVVGLSPAEARSPLSDDIQRPPRRVR
jgi:GMP synthase-like glutamine amidotransferase